MNNVAPAVLENFHVELIRRGLPIDYADRTTSELADHYRDLVAEHRATGLDASAASAEAARRLGDARKLAKKTIRDFQRRSWCGRWPLLTFLLGPTFTLAAMWIVVGTVLTAVGYVAEWCGLGSDGRMNRGEFLGSYGLWIAFTMVFPCLVLAFYWRLARRAAMSAVWPFTSCLSLAILAGQIFVAIDPTKAMVTAGIVFPSSLIWYTTHPSLLVQFTLPIATAFVLLARRRWEVAALQIAWNRATRSGLLARGLGL